MFWVFPWPWLFTWFYHSSSHSVLMVKWTWVYFKLASCRVLEAAKLNFVEHHCIFLVNTKSWGTFLEFFFDSDPSSWHLTLPLYAKTYRSSGWRVFYKKAVLIIFSKFTRHMFRAFILQLYLKRNSDTVYLWFCDFFFNRTSPWDWCRRYLVVPNKNTSSVARYRLLSQQTKECWKS